MNAELIGTQTKNFSYQPSSHDSLTITNISRITINLPTPYLPTCPFPPSMSQPHQTNQAMFINTIPLGFTIGTAPNGNQYLVPSHMVLALGQAFISYQTKIDIGVPSAVGGMSPDCLFTVIVLQALPHLLILYQSEQPQNTSYNIILV